MPDTRPTTSFPDSPNAPGDGSDGSDHSAVISIACTDFQARHAAQTPNPAFAVAIPDFREWCAVENLSLLDVSEADIDRHLDALERRGSNEGEVLARLCAIDMLVASLAATGLGRPPLSRSRYRRPLPPKLLVDSSHEDMLDSGTDFVTVFRDFLATHTARITRETYHNGLLRFFDWLGSDVSGARLRSVADMRGSHVSAFVASVADTDPLSGLHDAKPRTVGTILSGVRTYLDDCIAAGLLDKNVARAVRLPKVPTGRGATPVVAPDVVGRMISSIPLLTDADYRDRALIGTMAYSLFRVSAVCRMRVKDYQLRGNQRFLVSVEKRSKVHEMPVHDVLARYIDDYLLRTGLDRQPDAPLFQGSKPRSGELTGTPYSRNASWKMIQRRAKAAGHFGDIGNHSLRATGITAYLAAGGQLEEARKMAGHASAETTRLYDRNTYSVDPNEVGRIGY